MRSAEFLRTSLAAIFSDMGLDLPARTVVEPPKDAKFGDLSTNAAMLAAKEAKEPPRPLAEKLAAALAALPDIVRAEAAGPGFCNVTFAPGFWHRTVLDIAGQGDAYGSVADGGGRKVLVEFVSANPTGPLHVGHGRGAAIGDAVARLLRRCGWAVDTEYYVNDAGNQMRTLGLSVWLRVRECAGLPVTWPEDYYKGGYIADIAREMLDRDPSLPSLPDGEGRERCYAYAKDRILEGIREDLAAFRVEHARYFSEKSLVAAGGVDAAFAALAAAGHTYEKDGALWFAASKLGDDRDRVLRKSDGSLTYFAGDIAYHLDKYRRGFQRLIDVWGADHHGYIPRVKAAVAALGRDPDSLDVVLIQLVNLLKDGKPIAMSTRAGTFETLSDLVADVGVDAARFIFLSRKSDSPLDFDMDLVKMRTKDNPVYYVQYAHARICQVFGKAAERDCPRWEGVGLGDLAPLDTPEDIALLRQLDAFPDVVSGAGRALAVHHVVEYLTELAVALHGYYTKHLVLGDDAATSRARLALMACVALVLRNGLDILGVEALEKM
jgi:arginyl-tRNA synthetase